MRTCLGKRSGDSAESAKLPHVFEATVESVPVSAATLSEIFTYPIKSTVASSVTSSALGPRGLRFDRHWAIFALNGELLTARDHPDLLRLSTEVGDKNLAVLLDGKQTLTMAFDGHDGSQKEVDVWGVSGTGVRMRESVNRWFSEYLGIACEVVFMNEASSRPVTTDRGGKQGDVVSYADGFPVMLLSEATVTELNEKLDSPVPVTQFRPNLVVAGVKASAEDSWKRIKVGECELDITTQCKRCVFATIDPETRMPHENQEPLRTLTSYRRHPEGGVAMGMLAIPRTYGAVAVGDTVEVLA